MVRRASSQAGIMVPSPARRRWRSARAKAPLESLEFESEWAVQTYLTRTTSPVRRGRPVPSTAVVLEIPAGKARGEEEVPLAEVEKRAVRGWRRGKVEEGVEGREDMDCGVGLKARMEPMARRPVNTRRGTMVLIVMRIQVRSQTHLPTFFKMPRFNN